MSNTIIIITTIAMTIPQMLKSPAVSFKPSVVFVPAVVPPVPLVVVPLAVVPFAVVPLAVVPFAVVFLVVSLFVVVPPEVVPAEVVPADVPAPVVPAFEVVGRPPPSLFVSAETAIVNTNINDSANITESNSAINFLVKVLLLNIILISFRCCSELICAYLFKNIHSPKRKMC